MTTSTHIASGILVAAITSKLASPTEPAAVLAAIAGSLLPDLDSPSGKAHRVVAPIAAAMALLGSTMPQLRHVNMITVQASLLFVVVGVVSRHRTATHSLIAVVTLLFWTILSQAGLQGLALCVGVATHITLDALTEPGVRILWPARTVVRLARVQTGSPADFLIGLTCLAAAGALVLS